MKEGGLGTHHPHAASTAQQGVPEERCGPARPQPIGRADCTQFTHWGRPTACTSHRPAGGRRHVGHVAGHVGGSPGHSRSHSRPALPPHTPPCISGLAAPPPPASIHCWPSRRRRHRPPALPPKFSPQPQADPPLLLLSHTAWKAVPLHCLHRGGRRGYTLPPAGAGGAGARMQGRALGAGGAGGGPRRCAAQATAGKQVLPCRGKSKGGRTGAHLAKECGRAQAGARHWVGGGSERTSGRGGEHFSGEGDAVQGFSSLGPAASAGCATQNFMREGGRGAVLLQLRC